MQEDYFDRQEEYERKQAERQKLIDEGKNPDDIKKSYGAEKAVFANNCLHFFMVFGRFSIIWDMNDSAVAYAQNICLKKYPKSGFRESKFTYVMTVVMVVILIFMYIIFFCKSRLREGEDVDEKYEE